MGKGIPHSPFPGIPTKKFRSRESPMYSDGLGICHSPFPGIFPGIPLKNFRSRELPITALEYTLKCFIEHHEKCSLLHNEIDDHLARQVSTEAQRGGVVPTGNIPPEIVFL
ncbi:hypothetical protein ACFE04_025400 [Oxalis oulophora]